MQNNEYKGCWSRAALYELNATAGTAEIVWQFEDPQRANALAGSDDAARSEWYLSEVTVMISGS